MRFVVLGSTGMLGSEVTRVAKEASLDCVEVSRGEGIRFDATIQTFSELAEKLNLSAEDYVVNCIGWIPQKATDNPSGDAILAHALNERLPSEINESSRSLGFGWVQIATDCVFSGEKGDYLESSPKDALDLYGLSKIAGEQHSSHAMQIRCSIVGPDYRSPSGLYSWFLSRARTGNAVEGFRNHLWNGVSTTAFARLAVGFALAGLKSPLKLHWLPVGSVSKFKLLTLFALNQGFVENFVIEGLAPETVNRTLATLYPSKNVELWKIAGYDKTPTIEELVAEFVSQDKNRGHDEHHSD